MTNLNTPFMIGNVEIPNRTVLAPMAGVTNSAFRTIAKELGAGLVVMEMVSDKGIQYNNEKTLHMLHIDEGENPVSIQLFGSDEDSLARAAEFIQENTETDIVDINMGCPVNKIVKNEAGAMWLKDPDKIYSIINKVQSVLDIPLTVKMRTGWADPSLAVENALAGEAAGVSALAMHGRTREQMYTGHADLETLHKVAQALTKIPFIANGDIRTVQEAKQRIEEVGADAVMIGNVEIPNRTVLAPMAGVTNSAFRTIAKELGAGLVVMEMVSDKGIQYNNEKTLHMLHIDEGENPVSIQLFGSDEDSLARAAEFIQENTKTDIVDINMGCPVNKIVKNEAGAMWLKDPDKIYSIINKVQSVLDIPLTVKMRTGWADPSLAVENALAAEAAGVSALAMHGRTREQMYTGHADLETLHKIAQALTKIPFIANGDIRTVQEAKQRIEEVGADAVMIGRAAMGNPYLFNQINHYFETGEILPDLTFEDKMKIAYEHLKRLINLKGENIAVREFRGLAPHYLRGTSGAAKLRGAISQASTLAEIESLLQLDKD